MSSPTQQQQHGLTPPDYHTPEWQRLIRTMVFVVAGEMREAGADPTTVAPVDAWRYYRDRVEGSMRREQIIPPYEFALFLHSDGPGYAAFREGWLALRMVGTAGSLDGLSRARPGGWLPPYGEGVKIKEGESDRGGG